MHPQIKAEEKGKCPICFMDLIPLDLTKSLPSNVIELSENQQKSAGILTYPVLFEHDQKNIKLYGRVQLIPSKVVRITAWVGGRIDKLYVNSIGEKVNIGDPLYKIYSPSLISSQQELIQVLNLIKNSKNASSRFLSLKENLKAIRQKLLFLGISQKELIQIEKQSTPASHITVYAKRSGIVRHVALNEGEYVKEGNPILLIADMSKLWVEASVYEDDVQALHGPIKAFIILDSHPKNEIIAKLERIDPFVNAKTRSSRAIFSIDNHNNQYHEDGFARVQIESHSKKGILIPHSSALFTGQKAVVFVKEGIEFKSTLVRILEKTESYYRVLGDLKAGDEVVAQGTFKIDSEFQIQAKDSMMSAKELLSPYGSRLDLRNPIERAQDWLKIKKPSRVLVESLSEFKELYLELQLSLAENSFDESKDIMKEIHGILDAIDISNLEIHESQIIKLLRNSIKKSMKLAISTKVFKDFRFCFSILSQWVIAFTENTWLEKDEDLKKMFCPMAFDKKGAFWVQEDEEVMNPYFGTKMQKCGEQKKWSK
ncbi:MAG: efflux RND transporter periplasmic adaptor subunit, partial [Flavobacteriaceae bacterium]|nr:efflux RND transporter periplasmic adaptor subunit [Flavobacteriaceae bacterium]